MLPLLYTPLDTVAGACRRTHPYRITGASPYHGRKLRIKTLFNIERQQCNHTFSSVPHHRLRRRSRGGGGCHYHSSSLPSPQTPLTLSLPSNVGINSNKASTVTLPCKLSCRWEPRRNQMYVIMLDLARLSQSITWILAFTGTPSFCFARR